ncbi:MAG: radical SAM family heme chaperone HemW [Bdellovibrionota bacterium]
MSQKNDNIDNKLGLYFHIPFCDNLCHYCDFAKTANWNSSLTDKYFVLLEEHLKFWIHYLQESRNAFEFTSVFFGGGTPGLFADEMKPLFEAFLPMMQEGCEVSLEANPNNISEEKLLKWHELGITRISLGIQTFDNSGLNVLKRDHDHISALKALELLRNFGKFSVNLDLIYGWPGQSLNSWMTDIKRAIDSGIQHISLYNLIYEKRTPLGRRFFRGAVTNSPNEEQEVEFYEHARRELAINGFIHEEVSNWCKDGHTCEHNWLYWQDGSYVGVGSGAHGYLVLDDLKIGLRYSYPRNERFFTTPVKTRSPAASSEMLLEQLEVENRDDDSWLLEYVGCALRSVRGVDLKRIGQKIGRIFRPTPIIAHALKNGSLKIDSESILTLAPSEWIRETHWSLAVSECFLSEP